MKLALSEVEGYIEYSIYMQTTSSVSLKKKPTGNSQQSANKQT